jgi:hypothetical protein
MNLQENIHRIQSLLTENREEMIKNMIAKHGLYHAIKLMGGYENVLHFIDHENIDDEEKIITIKHIVKELSELIGESGISTYDTGLSPVRYSIDSYEEKVISYFGKTRVSVDVYGGHKYEDLVGTYAMDYENLPKDVLDNVLILMIDALENNM